MKLIILEDEVYRVTNKDYKLIRDKTEEIQSRDWYHGQDMDICNFIDSIKDRFTYVGVICYDFRL